MTGCKTLASLNIPLVTIHGARNFQAKRLYNFQAQRLYNFFTTRRQRNDFFKLPAGIFFHSNARQLLA